MCLVCGRLWTALQILWSTLYVICGAVQLMSGVFFTISVPELPLYNTLVAGSWNVIVGILAGMVSCLWVLSPKRQEMLLYLAVSLLAVACVNLILTEFWFYKTDMSKLHRNYANHMLIDYACFLTRISTAVVLVVSFLDSQFAFCSMQVAPRNKRSKLKGSHEHVSDIEYIIPRPKNSKPTSHTVYDAYAQSWVFDATVAAAPDNVDASTSTLGGAPYFKVLQNGKPEKSSVKGKQKNHVQNGMVTENANLLVDNPLVHVEEASDDSTSNSDRKLCHMKSFSRSQSPVVISAGSSQSSLDLHLDPTASSSSSHPPIYECLEKLTENAIYRSRLNTAVSVKEEEEVGVYQAPHNVVAAPMEKVQYASLMKELQRAIVHKKEPPTRKESSTTSPDSNASEPSEKTPTSKSSDADFSKELEAALQLIQDLESPNTAETPSEPPGRSLAVWRRSDASEKTLSAVGSLTELPDQSPASTTTTNGKTVGDSQSTSGYSSPTHAPTPDWSTTPPPPPRRRGPPRRWGGSSTRCCGKRGGCRGWRPSWRGRSSSRRVWRI